MAIKSKLILIRQTSRSVHLAAPRSDFCFRAAQNDREFSEIFRTAATQHRRSSSINTIDGARILINVEYIFVRKNALNMSPSLNPTDKRRVTRFITIAICDDETFALTTASNVVFICRRHGIVLSPVMMTASEFSSVGIVQLNHGTGRSSTI